MSPLSFCCATSMFLHLAPLHSTGTLEINCLAVPSGIVRGERKGRTTLGGSRGRGGKVGVIRVHQASHDFWEVAKLQSFRASITHTTPLAVPVSHLSGSTFSTRRPFRRTSIVDH